MTELSPEQTAMLMDLKEFRRVCNSITVKQKEGTAWQHAVIEFANITTDGTGIPQAEVDQVTLHIIDPKNNGQSRRFMGIVRNMLILETSRIEHELRAAGIEPDDYAVGPDE